MNWRRVFSWDPEEDYQTKQKRMLSDDASYYRSLTTPQAKARFMQLIEEFKQMYQIDTDIEMLPPKDNDTFNARYEQLSVYCGAEGSSSMWEVTKCLNHADAEAIISALEEHSADGKLSPRTHFIVKPATGGSYLDLRRLCDYLHKDFNTTREWVFEDAPEKRWNNR